MLTEITLKAAEPGAKRYKFAIIAACTASSNQTVPIGGGTIVARTAPATLPTVTQGVAVVGAFVSDGVSVDMPSGVVRAFDALTGQMRWAWDVGRPEPITQLNEGEIFTRGTPNAWSIFSAYENLGLIYIPTGNSRPDDYGSHRTRE